MDIRKIVGIGFLVVALVVAGYALADEERDAQMEAAREALNRAQYEEAAQLMSEVYERAKEKKEAETAGNALYWEAFARYRMKRTDELKRAVDLLQIQQELYAQAETAREGEVLLARLYAEMAERGEIEAITKIERISEEVRVREEIRIQALHSLMRMNPDKAMPILEKIVRSETDDSAEMRRNALFVLCRMDDDRSEDLLIDLAHSTTDQEMLSEIVMCLSMKDSERALDTIIALFEKGGDSGLEDEAMFAIGRHGGERAFRVLADIVQDPGRDSDIRSQALFALGQTGRDTEVAKIATELLHSADDHELMEGAMFTLSRLEEEVPAELFMDLVNNTDLNDDMRAQALFFAARRGDLSLETLMGVYDNADSRDLKLQVCHVISSQDDSEEALDALIRIARTETDLEIRQNIMFWIGRYDNDKAAEFLMEVISQN